MKKPFKANCLQIYKDINVYIIRHLYNPSSNSLSSLRINNKSYSHNLWCEQQLNKICTD